MTRDQDTVGYDTARDDIAPRLADAAAAIEIGAVPYEAVLRGGRRRKARRWVIGALAAVTIAGSTGSLALAVVDGGDGETPPSQGGTARERHVYAPQFTPLTELRDDTGKVLRIELQMWGAPRDDAEARAQKKAMTEAGVWDERTTDPVPDFDQPWYAIVVRGDGKQKVPSFGLQDEDPGGDDGLSFASVEFELQGREITVGHVGPRTDRVAYEYGGGTTEPDLHKAAGSDHLWFTRTSTDPGPSGELRSIRIYDGKGKVEVVQQD
ncbi:hypothetical protein [Streptomyces sp. NPDC002564]|uniref:hypothetical protein n=1 Tax=Streptomyces sp. NPDC002564 TaxID=3364649 RepID=UPI00369EE80F